MAMNQGAEDNRSLHELAVDIMQDIGLLATGLAHAGAPPNITDQIAGPAKLFSGIAKALAGGPVGAQPVGGQPGPPQGPPQGGAPAPAPPPSAPAAGPMTSGGQINGRSQQAPAQGDLHNAIVAMHHDAQNAVGRLAPR